MALLDRPPFSSRSLLTGHYGHGWTYTLPLSNRERPKTDIELWRVAQARSIQGA